MGGRSEKSDYSFAVWRELECQLPVAKEAKLPETFLTLSFEDIEQSGWNFSQPGGEAVQPQSGFASPFPSSWVDFAHRAEVGWAQKSCWILSPHQFVCGLSQWSPRIQTDGTELSLRWKLQVISGAQLEINQSLLCPLRCSWEWPIAAVMSQETWSVMKGRKSVPEDAEDASTQSACRTVVNVALETSRWQTDADSLRARGLSQPHPCHLPNDLGTPPEERKGEVGEKLWLSGSSVWAQSITLCDWWISFLELHLKAEWNDFHRLSLLVGWPQKGVVEKPAGSN